MISKRWRKSVAAAMAAGPVLAGGVFALAAISPMLLDGKAVAAGAAARFPSTAEQYDQMFDQTKTWGRWGPADQLGAVNLITDQKRKEAAALVRLGRTVSLSHEALTEPAADVPSPFEHTMNKGFSSDNYKTVVHGISMSHLDALCHATHHGLEYNGFLFKDVNSETGCSKLNVESYRNGLVTRGILIDIPRLKNRPYLEPGDQIFVEDIEAWEKKAGVKVSSGDAIFLRTGRWARRKAVGPWNINASSAGFHPSVIPWLKARGVSIIGTDAVADIVPSPIPGVATPIHEGVIAGLGIVLLDNQDPEAVAATAASLRRWDFMVVIAPLVVAGGTGSPANTIAIF